LISDGEIQLASGCRLIWKDWREPSSFSYREVVKIDYLLIGLTDVASKMTDGVNAFPIHRAPVESEATRSSNPPIPVIEQLGVKKVSLALLTLDPTTDPVVMTFALLLVVVPLVIL
jgi:hypothetical protein